MKNYPVNYENFQNLQIFFAFCAYGFEKFFNVMAPPPHPSFAAPSLSSPPKKIPTDVND